MLAWNVVTWFKPLLPGFNFSAGIASGRYFPPLSFNVSPWVVGICYFISPQVLFSLWFFQFMVSVEQGFFNRIGFATCGSDAWYDSNYASLGWQSWGAFCVFAFYGMWVARHHLADFFHRAWRGLKMEHDERELMSPRLAVLCLGAGMVYIVAFMARSGMSAPVIALFAPACIIAYFGITRIVVEGGLPHVRPTIAPQTFTMYTLGSLGMSAPTMVGIAFSYTWIVDMWSIFLPGTAQGAKLADWLHMNGRVIAIASIIGLVAALTVTLWYHVELSYDFGARNYNTGQFSGLGGSAFDFVAGKMRNPHGPDVERLGFMGFGAAVTAFLFFMRHRFAWWTLNPIGLTVPVAVGTKIHFGAFFLAWLIKIIIIRVGGQALYERGKPFFIGVVVGHLTGTLLYTVTEILFFPWVAHGLVL